MSINKILPTVTQLTQSTINTQSKLYNGIPLSKTTINNQEKVIPACFNTLNNIFAKRAFADELILKKMSQNQKLDTII